MVLLDFFFKTNKHRKLAQLLWIDCAEASVRELSLMSGLAYATTYEALHRMENMGLVKGRVEGKATLFRSNLSEIDQKALVTLFRGPSQQQSSKKVLDRLQELGLPMVGEHLRFSDESVSDDEELVVKSVHMAKENPTFARSLPVVLVKLLPNLNPHRLLYWAKRYKVKREVGFFVALTAHLSKKPTLKGLSKIFFDKRWSQPEYFFDADKDVRGFQSRLVDKNTPPLAKIWKLKMNMGLDSFESLFSKFMNEGI